MSSLHDLPLLQRYELDINGAGEALLMLPFVIDGSAPDLFDVSPNMIVLIRDGQGLARVAPIPDELHEDLMSLQTLLLAELEEGNEEDAPRVTELRRFT
ncbi:MAG: hypothetical protein Alpg2KO_21810 [Alphaproteobacteria bacterium]